MNRPHSTIYELQKLIDALSKVERNHQLLNSDRHENDIEHSLAVALLCWYIIESNDLKLDQALVFKYAMAHDFVEKYAGDVNTFASEQERSAKAAREQEAIITLESDFPNFPDMTKLLSQYDQKTTEEALFVWTVDKIQAIVLGGLDNWRPYKHVNVTYEAFCDKYQEIIDAGSPYCKQILESIFEYSKSTYYDKPKG